MKLKENLVQIKLDYNDNQLSLHADFEELLGAPAPRKLYQLDLAVGAK